MVAWYPGVHLLYLLGRQGPARWLPLARAFEQAAGTGRGAGREATDGHGLGQREWQRPRHGPGGRGLGRLRLATPPHRLLLSCRLIRALREEDLSRLPAWPYKAALPPSQETESIHAGVDYMSTKKLDECACTRSVPQARAIIECFAPRPMHP